MQKALRVYTSLDAFEESYLRFRNGCERRPPYEAISRTFDPIPFYTQEFRSAHLDRKLQTGRRGGRHAFPVKG